MSTGRLSSMDALATSRVRLAVTVSGIVQGVGFRPFVYGLAVGRALAGFVRNAGGAVEIEVEGGAAIVDDFLLALRSEAPPLAKMDGVEVKEIACRAQVSDGFEIQTSGNGADAEKAVPADTATCSDCLRELFDPEDRRFRFPFINCTNCGPRFTIIKALPYDRSATTMAEFAMCRLCKSEYDDPLNRRFHAQPNACRQCGPSLKFRRSAGPENDRTIAEDRCEASLGMAVELLRQGGILAVKGLGGFHLMCDAGSVDSVGSLRQRKGRYGKPLAVLMSTPDMVRRYCHMSDEEEGILLSSRRPIVLLRKLTGAGIAPGVAPGIDHLGVMLPYTPLHHLISTDFGAPLVATSGNKSDEPIAIDNQEAMSRLFRIADAFLLHNRAIESRYDDSVSRVFQGAEILIRRSRGYAPVPLRMAVAAKTPVLACGGHLKNTFCLVSNDKAFVSQHIGDLDSIESMQHFQASLERFMNLFSIEPGIVVHDLHPDYLSTSLAREIAGTRGLTTVAVQHHHAHIASCMAEHGLVNPVIGVAFDGLGYGLDGSAWGGEFLVCDWRDFDRRGYFEPVPMPGGSSAIKLPWRMALGYLFSNPTDYGPGILSFVDAMRNRYGDRAVSVIRQQAESRFNAPATTSCGRLFDAVSALLGVCPEASYEGQAAMELEALVARAHLESSPAGVSGDELRPYPYELAVVEGKSVIRPHSILKHVYEDVVGGISLGTIAARFHHTLACIVLEVCSWIRGQTGLAQVCLGGGVFQNVVLLEAATGLLRRAGFEVFYPRQLPANDGGLSLGQAVVALAKLDALGRLREQRR